MPLISLYHDYELQHVSVDIPQGLLEALLSTWRTTFGFPAMPFVIVQLAAYIPRYASRSQPFRSNLNHWPYVREAQRQARFLHSRHTLSRKRYT